jgi:hypothetical protein
MTDESRSPATHQPIPGERDPDNLTTRIPHEDHLPWLYPTTADEHAHEGGLSGKKRKK